MDAAQRPLTDITAALRDLQRCRVLELGPELDPLEPDSIESPVRQELERAVCNASPPGLGRDDVADLSLQALEAQHDERDHPEERAARRIEDGEPRPRAVGPS